MSDWSGRDYWNSHLEWCPPLAHPFLFQNYCAIPPVSLPFHLSIPACQLVRDCQTCDLGLTNVIQSRNWFLIGNQTWRGRRIFSPPPLLLLPPLPPSTPMCVSSLPVPKHIRSWNPIARKRDFANVFVPMLNPLFDSDIGSLSEWLVRLA